MNKTPPDLVVLASSSPRRRQYLQELGIPFTVLAPDLSEDQLPSEKPHSYVMRVAADKARAALDRLRQRSDAPADCLIVAADTAVVLGDVIMGKPATDNEATHMLRRLSGRTHQVMTGLCLLRHAPPSPPTENIFHVETDVCFKSLTEEEISAYVRSGSPFDKAGGYGIQDRAGTMIHAIRGSYTNVVGLPMAELADALAAQGVRIP